MPSLDWKQALTLVVSFSSGGLAGAVFNQWYTGRSTVLEYTITRTVLGSEQATVVPNFRVQVGDTSFQTLHLYTIKIRHVSGPELENAKIGIALLNPAVKLVGNTVRATTGVAFDFTCAPFEARTESTVTTCILGRLSSTAAYALSFATDNDVQIRVSVNAKNTQIREVIEPLPTGARDWQLIMSLGLLFTSLLYLVLVERYEKNQMRLLVDAIATRKAADGAK